MVDSGGRRLVREQMLARGFQSSVDPILHFGLGDAAPDRVTVTWPGGKTQTIAAPELDAVLTLRQEDATAAPQAATPPRRFRDVTEAVGLTWRHRENDFDDYARELLLPHRLSQLGPALAVGDSDGDGDDEVYLGGAQRQPGVPSRQHDRKLQPVAGPWKEDAESEDVAATWFDADGDGDLDLYVVSGGNERAASHTAMQDRLYLNAGAGKFRRGALPAMPSSGGCVASGDYDGDGDLDLFVGGRVSPGKYPLPARSYVLQNDGGTFTDVTSTVAPALVEPGMVTAASWSDVDGDGRLDLLVVGEWMPILLLHNDGTKLLPAEPPRLP